MKKVNCWYRNSLKYKYKTFNEVETTKICIKQIYSNFHMNVSIKCPIINVTIIIPSSSYGAVVQQ